jgi:hypothetical protein
VEDSGGRGEEEVVLLWAVLEWTGVVAGVEVCAWTAGGTDYQGQSAEVRRFRRVCQKAGGAIVVWGGKMSANRCSSKITK